MDREVFDALHKWAIEQCRFGQTPTKLAHEIIDALDKAGFVIERKPTSEKIKTRDEMRELLALEYERENGPMHKSAEFIRLTKYRGVVSVDLAIAAMHCAFKAGRADAMGAADETKPTE